MTNSDYEAEVERVGAMVDPVSHTVKVFGHFSEKPKGIVSFLAFFKNISKKNKI